MSAKVSFLNWSLNKVLDEETDSLNRAKYKIVYTIFILFFIKGICAISVAYYYHQSFQLYRTAAFLLLYFILFKGFLSKLISIKTVGHFLIISGAALVFTNLFVTAKAVNVITLQFVFTSILASFYVIGSRSGIFYSSLLISLILFSMAFGNDFVIYGVGEALASPGYEIILILNFITIIYIPYIFHQSFINTIKDKEELNAKLTAAVEASKQAAQAKSNFLSTMSHELRTPLNTVIGTTDLLLSEPFNQSQESNLNDLKFSADCLYNIVNDILDFNKLDSSKLKLEAIQVNLKQLVENVCSGLIKQAKEKGIDLNLSIPNEIADYSFETDPTRITQIIFNLVGNAIKFTPKGSVNVGVEIVKKTDRRIKLHFYVKDTGIGINDAKKESIFEPFHQESSSITRNYGGTGLGLAIVKRLLLLFNSNINLRSRVGKGSEFSFDIDFKYKNRVMQQNQTEAVDVYDISDLKVLVAEDNKMNRVLIKKVFSKWNNEPVFAENGQIAIDMAKDTAFDIILMDLHMPEVDGYEASKVIRADVSSSSNKAHIIAFTASVSATILIEIEAAGMNDFIYKPFNTNEMYEKLRQVKPALITD